MRFTDVERNILFASTDMQGLTKQSLEPGRIKDKENQEHYSKTYSHWLWGTKGVYKNNLVSKMNIVLNEKHSDSENTEQQNKKSK